MAWKPGDRLTHRFNPDLGPGVVREVAGRTVIAYFPASDTSLRLAATSDAICPLVLRAGRKALLQPAGEPVVIAAVMPERRILLADGREVDERDVWPAGLDESLFERLAQGEIDPLDAFALRLDALHLAGLRESGGLGSYLGGRIRLFPHQLYVALRATASDPVRWLLADEVGLGKTVEACLILNHLVRTRRSERVLVVAPGTLTVQWLGELWRKYHQVFVLLDDDRLADVERDFGRGFNPFETYRRVVVGLEYLRERPRLTEQAVEAGIDLLIVDEAHRLRRPPGHPGSGEYRAVAPIAALGRHVLLLTATPLEEDAHGFFRLLQLLRPSELADDAFEDRLRRGEPLPPCTSATRRVDVGGLPPRSPRRIDLAAGPGWDDQLRLERALRAVPATQAVARREKAAGLRLALSSGHAIEPSFAPDHPLRGLARQAGRTDPRLAWLVEQADAWRERGDKTLVFVAVRETLEVIKAVLSREAQLRVGVFHELLSPGQRDIEVAQFRLSSGPSLLVSTECGGEGRNFEFCTRLVLYDLPWSPMLVEQRIGRLDRIGRRLPVEILYLRPPVGLGAIIADLYAALGLFDRPLGGLERELTGVERFIEELALSDAEEADPKAMREVVDRTREAATLVEAAAFHELHREPYRAELGQAILASVPADLEELTRDVVLAAAEQLHLHVEEHREGSRHSIELGLRASVESLPGVPAGASFLGTFEREEAVADESIDFFASGHPLVEGLLAHIEEAPAGRVALLHVGGTGQQGFGLLALYKSGLGAFEAAAVDLEGNERPDWAELLTRRPLRTRRVKPESWSAQPGWAETVRGLAERLAERGTPLAVAAFRLE